MQTVLVLFGGVSPEHAVSLVSGAAVLRNLRKENRKILPVGITLEGKWLLYGGDNYDDIAADKWEQHPDNRTAFLSPERGMGLRVIEKDGVRSVPVDVIFPVLHGENGEDGSVQGLFQLSGIPFVGCGICASAVSMDKSVTKLIAATTGVRQANWLTLRRADFRADAEAMCRKIMENIAFPVFIKPCSTGSSVGVSKVKDETALMPALEAAFKFDKKILAEEFINGMEVEVAVFGNEAPVAAVAGEIDAGAEFYDYETKYVTSTSQAFIPARISSELNAEVRAWAVKVYSALGCAGLSRVDFFVTRDTNEIVFNEINTLPGFTPISMYPKMWAAEGKSFPDLLDDLIALALEG